ncbi:glutamate racemase [Virgibacillus sp. YIM 98842]|uniref:glutamate racemase n=1 Tax=Virgibacillus sp. YIM 98842 TaxID=2663533 RepID=UPI0013DA6DC9|nr:glutamate racemase [Virgibacillus sp. YIM 98842]
MERAIGVIDSGVGGLTVAGELMRQLPNEQIIYVGDTARCPYGPRSKEEVLNFTCELVDFLLNQHIKMLVIACNTATAFTLHHLQKKLPIPVVGVIQPGARAAIKYTENNYISVIATEGTAKSGAYAKAIKNINPDIHVNTLACPSFVEMIEQGFLSGNKVKKIVENTLEPIKQGTQMDTLILGCTHYPLIKHVIQSVVGEHVELISSSEETARETSTVLDVHQLLNNRGMLPVHQFYTTGELETFKTLSCRIFQKDILKSVRMEKVNLNNTHISKLAL